MKHRTLILIRYCIALLLGLLILGAYFAGDIIAALFFIVIVALITPHTSVVILKFIKNKWHINVGAKVKSVIIVLAFIIGLGTVNTNKPVDSSVASPTNQPPSFNIIKTPIPSPQKQIESTPLSPIPSKSPTKTAEPTYSPKPTKNTVTSKPVTPKPTATTVPVVQTNPGSNSTYSGGDKDCSDFSSHEEAQAYFLSKGGSPSNNVDRLDRDRDGLACENN